MEGFRKHGRKWLARVLLDDEDAIAVSAEAEKTGAAVGAVIRALVRKGLGR